MREQNLRRLFVRYRERGDLDAIAKVFEATAPALLALGRHLTSRPEDAEDAVQATYITAIERRASYDASSPLESWLFGILLRKARRVGEREGRRPDPRRLREPGAEDPEREARAAELSESLAQAVAGLPETYRSVLEPYLRDERPQEIARLSGVAAGTVRVRIHRGLEMLRKALPAGFAAGSVAVALNTAEVARVRHAVLQAARAGSAGAPQGVVLATAGTAATRVLLACGAIVVAVGVWQFSASERSRTEPAVTVARAAADGAGDLPVREGLEERTPSAGGNNNRVKGIDEPSAVPDASGQWTLELRVSGLDVPPPGLLLLDVRTSAGESLSRRMQLEGNGALRTPIPSEWIPEGADCPVLELDLDHALYANWSHTTSIADLGDPKELAVEVVLERRFSVITGRIASACSSEPLVAFYPFDREADDGSGSRLEAEDQAGCVEDGRFRLCVGSSAGWFVAATEGCTPVGEWQEWSGIRDHDLGLIELEDRAAIEGVAYVDGRPTQEPAQVVAERRDIEGAPRARLAGIGVAFLGDELVTLGGDAYTDPDGRFRIGGLTPGAFGVIMLPPLRMSGMYSPIEHGTWVDAPAGGIELGTPMRGFHFEVVTQGRPVADASVHVFFGGGGSISAPTGADGRHSLSLAESFEKMPIRVSKPGFVTLDRSVSPADFGPSRVLQLEFERAEPASALNMEFGVAGGGAFGSADVELSLVGANWSLRRKLPPGVARLEIAELPAGAYTLRCTPFIDPALAPELQARWFETEFELECRADAREEPRLELPAAGRVAFHLTGFDPAETAGWWIRGGEGHLSTHFMLWSGIPPAIETIYVPMELPADTTVWLRAALAPGDYELTLSSEGKPRSFPFTIIGGELTDVFVELD